MKVHVDAPAALNAPAGQLVQEDAPAALNAPGGQLALSAFVAQKEPAGHASVFRVYTMPEPTALPSLKKHMPTCAPYFEKNGPNEGGCTPLAFAISVPEAPVRAQEALVATEAPAAAAYTEAKSLPTSVPHAAIQSTRRWPGSAWWRDSCSALFA